MMHIRFWKNSKMLLALVLLQGSASYVLCSSDDEEYGYSSLNNNDVIHVKSHDRNDPNLNMERHGGGGLNLDMLINGLNKSNKVPDEKQDDVKAKLKATEKYFKNYKGEEKVSLTQSQVFDYQSAFCRHMKAMDKDFLMRGGDKDKNFSSEKLTMALFKEGTLIQDEIDLNQIKKLKFSAENTTMEELAGFFALRDVLRSKDSFWPRPNNRTAYFSIGFVTSLIVLFVFDTLSSGPRRTKHRDREFDSFGRGGSPRF